MVKIASEGRDNTYCCVPQCNARGSKNTGCSFHRFPKEYSTVMKKGPNNERYFFSRRKEWIQALKIGREISSRMVVCSRHFKESDYNTHNLFTRKPTLKPTAVPTKNLPVLSSHNANEACQKQKKCEVSKGKKKQPSKHSEIRKGLPKQKKKCAARDDSTPSNSSTINTATALQQLQHINNSYEEHSYTEENVNRSSECISSSTDEFSENVLQKIEIKEQLGGNDSLRDVYVENKLMIDESSEIKIKEEPHWDENYILHEDVAAEYEINHSENIQDETQDSASTLNNEEREIIPPEKEQNENSRTLHMKITEPVDSKYMEHKISEREIIFGRLIASELSTICKNPQLYIKTKQIILNALSDAQIKLITSDSSK